MQLNGHRLAYAWTRHFDISLEPFINSLSNDIKFELIFCLIEKFKEPIIIFITRAAMLYHMKNVMEILKSIVET